MVPVEGRRYTVSFLQFVERKHLEAGLCSTGYRTSEMVRKQHMRLSMGGIVTPLNNDFLKSSRAPKGLQRCVTWGSGGGGICPTGSYLIFSPKIKKIVANALSPNF